MITQIKRKIKIIKIKMMHILFKFDIMYTYECCPKIAYTIGAIYLIEDAGK